MPNFNEIKLLPVLENGRSTYWDFISGLDFDLCMVISMWFCSCLSNFVVIRWSAAECNATALPVITYRFISCCSEASIALLRQEICSKIYWTKKNALRQKTLQGSDVWNLDKRKQRRLSTTTKTMTTTTTTTTTMVITTTKTTTSSTARPAGEVAWSTSEVLSETPDTTAFTRLGFLRVVGVTSGTQTRNNAQDCCYNNTRQTLWYNFHKD